MARALPEATLLLADLEPTPTVRGTQIEDDRIFFREFSRLLVFLLFLLLGEDMVFMVYSNFNEVMGFLHNYLDLGMLFGHEWI